MKTIIVYDKKNYFFRFIKHHLKDYYVLKESNLNRKSKNIYSSANYIFIVVYDELDIFRFLFFYRLNKNIFVCAESDSILSYFKAINEVLCFDIGLSKGQIINNIKEVVYEDYLYSGQ